MTVRGFALACVAAAFGAAAAQAQTAIGFAERSLPDVTGQLGTRRAVIAQGAAVHQNEVIQTSAAGRAMLQFRDSTILDVGPSSNVKLDRFVYNADETARQAVVTMTRGAFRWVTGVSEPRVFRLQTPHALIGIRGTIVEFAIDPAATTLQVLRGAVNVCAGGTCVDVYEGGGASVSSVGISLTPPPLFRERSPAATGGDAATGGAEGPSGDRGDGGEGGEGGSGGTSGPGGTGGPSGGGGPTGQF